TGKTDQFNQSFIEGIKKILDVFKTEHPGGCNPTARSLRDRSFVFSSVGLTHRKRLVELWLLFKIH
ncbi:hypothetical protein SJ926_13440, partial [Enterococcus faecium]